MQNLIEPVRLQVLPQEIIYEIISFVPEYGHRVSKYLHRKSVAATEASIYCDFYRHGARLSDSRIYMCFKILKKDGPEDLKDGAIRYLKKNPLEVVSMYLENRCTNYKNVLEHIGITNAGKISCIDYGYLDYHDVYKSIEWRTKVIRLYSLMILRDSGMMTKKEFDTKCLKISDLATILEIVFGIFPHYDHIYNTAIRYFSSVEIMSDVIKRLENEAAVIDGLVIGREYSYDAPKLSRYMKYQETSKKMDRNNLLKIRDQILGVVIDDIYHYSSSIDTDDIREAFFMIESLADEE